MGEGKGKRLGARQFDSGVGSSNWSGGGVLSSPGHGLDLTDFAAQYFLGCDKLIRGLQVHPELRGCAEKLRQPYGHVGAYAGLFKKDVIDSLSVYIDRFGEPISGYIHGLKKLML
jgi:hypothetical protein